MTGSCVVIRHRLALLLATMALAGGVAFPLDAFARNEAT